MGGHALSRLSGTIPLTPEQERLLTPRQLIWAAPTPPENRITHIQTILAAASGALLTTSLEIQLTNVTGLPAMATAVLATICILAALRLISLAWDKKEVLANDNLRMRGPR